MREVETPKDYGRYRLAVSAALVRPDHLMRNPVAIDSRVTLHAGGRKCVDC